MNWKYWIVGMMGCALVSSCEKLEEDFTDSSLHRSVVLQAALLQPEQARSIPQEGAVLNGEFTFGFTPKGSNFRLNKCVFQAGLGYVFENNQALTWAAFNTGAEVDYYLDNFIEDRTTTSVNTNIPLTDDQQEKYQAVVDNETKTNDLVWQKLNKQVGQNDATLVFDGLTHRMSRITVQIESEVETITEQLGKTVKVELTNVLTKPATYNRYTGTVTANTGTRETLVLLDGLLDNSGKTPSWILPPQTLPALGSPSRPQLKITSENGITYTGYLPESMIVGAGGNEAQVLAFNTGRHLTIRVKLVGTAENTPIQFLPAVVTDWVNKGTYDISSKQVGIYTWEQWVDCVAAYNDEETENRDSILKKYGTFDESTSKWTFNLFANIVIPGGVESPSMFNDETVLNFNGYTVKDSNGNLSGTIHGGGSGSAD